MPIRAELYTADPVQAQAWLAWCSPLFKRLGTKASERLLNSELLVTQGIWKASDSLWPLRWHISVCKPAWETLVELLRTAAKSGDAFIAVCRDLTDYAWRDARGEHSRRDFIVMSACLATRRTSSSYGRMLTSWASHGRWRECLHVNTSTALEVRHGLVHHGVFDRIRTGAGEAGHLSGMESGRDGAQARAGPGPGAGA